MTEIMYMQKIILGVSGILQLFPFLTKNNIKQLWIQAILMVG
jgi:hypothetical protein